MDFILGLPRTQKREILFLLWLIDFQKWLILFHATRASMLHMLPIVGTCSLVQGDPMGVCSDVNRVLARDGNSSVNLASQGHCAGVFIGV
jgi:hypothetical protein